MTPVSSQRGTVLDGDAAHGSGLGAGLLAAVLPQDEEAMLWVADPNPRAQAFYRRHGFLPDGTEKVDDGVREIRLIRRREIQDDRR
jgi:predicted GNAT family N-acyltransferase